MIAFHMLLMSLGGVDGLTTAELGIVVTVVLFATAHLIMLMRWGSSLDKSTGILANRIDSLADGLAKVENALSAIADVNVRFNYLEKTVIDNRNRFADLQNDHEARIRKVEQSCSRCGTDS